MTIHPDRTFTLKNGKLYRAYVRKDGSLDICLRRGVVCAVQIQNGKEYGAIRNIKFGSIR